VKGALRSLKIIHKGITPSKGIATYRKRMNLGLEVCNYKSAQVRSISWIRGSVSNQVLQLNFSTVMDFKIKTFLRNRTSQTLSTR
jgi:hypothetical protein